MTFEKCYSQPMRELVTFRSLSESATAQPRNRAIVRGILARKSASFRRCRVTRDDCPDYSAAAPVLTTTAPNFGGASVLANRAAPKQKPSAPNM